MKRAEYFEAFKIMLQKKDTETAEKEKASEYLEFASNFLSHVSLRHYIDMTVDALLTNTYAILNPLTYGGDLDLINDSCQKVNGKMRDIHGSFDVEFSTPIKEFVSWCALFPEKEGELIKEAFATVCDEDAMWPIGHEIVFAPIFGASTMGDELPLPKMALAINFAMYIALVAEDENELAEKLTFV